MDELNKRLALVLGTCDTMVNGSLVTNALCRVVFVETEAQLATLPAYEPGTFAALYGLGKLWQKTPAGEWAVVV